jgi:hypothetical protein
MTPESPHSPSERLKFLTAFAFIATFGMWLNFLYYSWFPGPLRWTYPDDTFQAVQVSRFSDFYDMVYLNRDRDPYNTRHLPPLPPPHIRRTAYPPFANLFYFLLSRFDIDYGGTSTDGPSKAQDGALWLFFGIPFLVFPALIVCWLEPPNPWLTYLLVVIGFDLSYPMLFAIDRGNLELWILIPITVFAWLANAGSLARRRTAVAAVGVAAALKIYPLIFILVYLKQRRWMAALGAVAVAGVLTLAGYLALRGGPLENLSAHLGFMRDASGEVRRDLQWATWFSSSLFSLVFLTLKALLHWEKAAAWFLRNYSPLLALFALGTAGVLAIRRLSFARLLAAVCCLAILVTPESPDYKLLLLFPATVALIAEGGGSRVFNLLFVAIVGMLLFPKNWVFIFEKTSSGSIFDPILVLSLLALVVAAPPRKDATNYV